ncbi:D-tagatose 3-epimerase [Burkholderia lata]|uniref:sugar phosphate isomerase/epimerase family protein n=1 Tax=Burkholderia lata (strain ATCC 17760 / DSM 23089 / LMG 22485 / NCIMB 9086 / R18194 / 383) TaxID=482957 RepID=UPI001453B15A|nr:sugar phosphate isomerase/epimerase family protein [Burkholderia lata]VWC05444.1 D-tagatose 3-epimerase [Burkholderia lata]
MKLAISNIAWDVDEDEAVTALLKRYDVNAIDIAPGKYFPDPAQASDADIAKVRTWWCERGIAITGMQALLFGTTGLNVFGSVEVQDNLLRHLSAVCRIGAGLDAPRLVFGSPKNRDRSGLTDTQAIDVAVPFFRRLGEIAQDHGVTICLEPNPTRYGANFMTTSAETAEVVRLVDHPSIKMQFDTGALTINGETPEQVLAPNARLIGHIHASEPGLAPLGDGSTDHHAIHTALRQYLPDHLVTIEMVATTHEPHLISIERALMSAVEHYRHSNGVSR